MTKKLVLVDGSSYLHRAYNALPELRSPDGQPTGAVYGVVNMLRALVRQQSPDRLAVVFDARGKTFRHEMFPEYKAHRPPTPEDLKAQVQTLFRAVEASGYPLLQVAGVEADDVIGTLARDGARRGCAVVISTCDKDMTQLLGDGVTIVDTMKNEILDAAKVRAKFGVAAARVADFLALTGDKSDNIPGVPGVGPKTAARWLAEHGDLDGVIANAAKVKGKAGENLRAAAPALPLYRDLTTIRCDLALDVDIDALAPRAPDVAALRALFEEYGFASLLRQLPSSAAPSAAPPAAPDAARRGYRLILSEASLHRWLERLAACERFAFGVHAAGADYLRAEIVGVAFALAEGPAAYVPLAHDYDGAPRQLPRAAVLERLRPLLEAETPAKVGYNLKYQRQVLANHGISLRGIGDDAMLAAYVYNSVAVRDDLADAGEKYLDVRAPRYDEIAGKGARQKPFNRVALKSAGDYAAACADVGLRLHRHLQPLLEKQGRPAAVYRDIEMPLLPVLADVERRGVLIDRELLAALSTELGADVEQVSRRAFELAGREFNLDSPKQIQQVLFDEAGLPVAKKTPKGQPSTAEEVLTALAADYELPRVILEFRSLSKLKSTYADKLPAMINAESGRVHTCYHQAVTATGRLSSSDPNLQNIPVRTARGRRIRRAFVAAAGRKLIAADYSQIEMRIMAHLSRDENLLAVFAQDGDVHAATAAEVFATTPDKIDADRRRIAKAINFGLIYGMSAYGLAKQLGLARRAAQDYVDAYFERYPGVRRYMERTRERARARGYVETIFGRRLYVPEINAKNAPRRRYAERTAINAPMQGSAADVIKRAMIVLHRRLARAKTDAAIIMQVHDELVLEAAAEQAEEVMAQCRECMGGAADLAAPLVVTIAAGDDWDEAH